MEHRWMPAAPYAHCGNCGISESFATKYNYTECKTPNSGKSGSAVSYACGGWLVEWGEASVYRKTKYEATKMANDINCGGQWEAKIIELFKKT